MRNDEMMREKVMRETLMCDGAAWSGTSFDAELEENAPRYNEPFQRGYVAG